MSFDQIQLWRRIKLTGTNAPSNFPNVPSRTANCRLAALRHNSAFLTVPCFISPSCFQPWSSVLFCASSCVSAGHVNSGMYVRENDGRAPVADLLIKYVWASEITVKMSFIFEFLVENHRKSVKNDLTNGASFQPFGKDTWSNVKGSVSSERCGGVKKKVYRDD